MRKRVTIKDIGAEVGVSWTTVSRVLTGGSFSERISPETKERILAAAARLGYTPNPSGVALKRGYTYSIALLAVNWDIATAHSRAVTRLTQVTRAQGLSTTIYVASDDTEGQLLVESIRHAVPYGLVLMWDSVDIPIEELAAARSDGLPIVDLMPPLPGGPVSVTWDRKQGFQIGVKHLTDLGHRKIAIIRPAFSGMRTTSAKLEGYQLGLAEAGIPYDESLVLDVEGDGFEDGYSGLNSVLERRPDVTAIMCMDDQVAAGVVAAARDRGLAVPADLSVMGYGARVGWHLIPPRLTTLAARATPIVEKSVEYIKKMREDPDFVPEPVCVPMVLVIGGSTGPAP